jgi:hypothetical protein
MIGLMYFNEVIRKWSGIHVVDGARRARRRRRCDARRARRGLDPISGDAASRSRGFTGGAKGTRLSESVKREGKSGSTIQ